MKRTRDALVSATVELEIAQILDALSGADCPGIIKRGGKLTRSGIAEAILREWVTREPVEGLEALRSQAYIDHLSRLNHPAPYVETALSPPVSGIPEGSPDLFYYTLTRTAGAEPIRRSSPNKSIAAVRRAARASARTGDEVNIMWIRAGVPGVSLAQSGTAPSAGRVRFTYKHKEL